MAITDYTSYGDIRASLGVADQEIPDQVLDSATLWFSLKYDLLDIGASVISDLDAVLLLPSPTVDEEKFKEVAQAFSTFQVANQLLDSLPMFAPKAIIEGKSDVTRFSDSPFIETSKRVQASYSRFRKLLVESYAGYKGSTTSTESPAPIMKVASPSYDPVTGA